MAMGWRILACQSMGSAWIAPLTHSLDHDASISERMPGWIISD